MTRRARSRLFGLTLATACILPASGHPAATEAVAAQRAGGGGANAISPPIGIDGRTIDAQGRAVPSVFVTLLRNQSGAPVPMSGASVMSDREGRYAFDQLQPGSYFVRAVPSYAAGEALLGQPRGYRLTFFPSALDATTATPVVVTFNGRTTAVITMLEARLATVSGSVTMANGQPAKNASLYVVRDDGVFGTTSYFLPLNDDGTFTATQISPGTFHLLLREPPWPSRNGDPVRVSGAKVVVEGADISGVRVTPIPVLSVSGRVVVDAADRARLRPADVRLTLMPLTFEAAVGATFPSTPLEDLSFSLRAYPGRVRVTATIADRQWKVVAIRLDGVEITAAGFELRTGSPVGQLEVTLTRTLPK